MKNLLISPLNGLWMEAVDLIATALGCVSFRRQVLQEFEKSVRLP
jgi:hypothetical protein